MKIKVLYLVPLLLAATIDTACAAGSLDGTWGFSTDNGGPKPICTLVQKGQAISGTCKGPTNEGPITGTLRGNMVKLAWAGSTTGVRKRFDFAGVWDSKRGTITGKVNWTILQLASADVVTAKPPDAPLDFIATKIQAAPK